MDEAERTMSNATYKRGLAELIAKRFIAAMPAPGWYWVNPDYIWNGDRLAFVKEYYRKQHNQRDRKNNKLA